MQHALARLLHEKKPVRVVDIVAEGDGDGHTKTIDVTYDLYQHPYMVPRGFNEFLSNILLQPLRRHCSLLPEIVSVRKSNDEIHFNIPNYGKTLDELVRTASLGYEAFRSAVFQAIWMALFFNRHAINHNDYHLKNIVVETTNAYKTYDSICLMYGVEKYYLPANTLVRVIDFELMAFYGDISLMDSAIATDSYPDKWNLRPVQRSSFDILTFLAHLLDKVWINFKAGGNPGLEAKQYLNLVEGLLETVVQEAVRQRGAPIPQTENKITRQLVAQRKSTQDFARMLSDETLRPYEDYCQLDLRVLLDHSMFAVLKRPYGVSAIVATTEP